MSGVGAGSLAGSNSNLPGAESVIVARALSNLVVGLGPTLGGRVDSAGS